MFRSCLASLAAAVMAASVASVGFAETIRFEESLRVEDTRLPVPMELTLRALSETREKLDGQQI